MLYTCKYTEMQSAKRQNNQLYVSACIKAIITLNVGIINTGLPTVITFKLVYQLI